MSYPTSAYIHLPFCRRRCYYCDFAISVVGDKPLKSDSTVVSDYVEHLNKEIQLSAVRREPLKTVFFGGGTPSLLPVVRLKEILQTIDRCFGIATDAEISLEIDPGTFDGERLKQYLDVGINRFSLGVQTFESELLKLCGRTHSVGDIYNAVELINQAGIKNYSLDLMTGLPQQTISDCEQSLKQAIAIAPAHLSCYDLVLEPVTAFGKLYEPGETPLPTNEATAEMYRLTQKMLSDGGYQHYEISNYALPGYQCHHNLVYWRNQEYYGFGMSAASYVENVRYTRPRTRKAYYEWVKQGATTDEDPLTQNDRLLETLMLGLRLAEGVDLAAVEKEHRKETIPQIANCLQPYIKQNLVAFSDRYLKLQDPEGFLLSNTILATLFEKLGND